jgi:hypothetical protein
MLSWISCKSSFAKSWTVSGPSMMQNLQRQGKHSSTLAPFNRKSYLNAISTRKTTTRQSSRVQGQHFCQSDPTRTATLVWHVQACLIDRETASSNNPWSIRDLKAYWTKSVNLRHIAVTAAATIRSNVHSQVKERKHMAHSHAAESQRSAATNKKS